MPVDKGVCTDVVIRAYRKLGIDLQKNVHEDMKANFGRYPKNWGLTRPDPNIDHRRVPNLMTFFSRYGEVLEITDRPEDYKQEISFAGIWDVEYYTSGSFRMSLQRSRFLILTTVF